MKITIANRLRPFSHEPGTYCLLPGSCIRMQIFPALIRVHDLSTQQPRLITEITLDLPIPLLDFTVQLDLEKGRIHVWGKSLRYSLVAAKEPDALFAVITSSKLSLSCTEKCQVFAVNETTRVIGFSGYAANALTLYQPPPCARLSLGSHKAQDWPLVKRRKSMNEVFPFWYRIGQTLTASEAPSGGTAALLKACHCPDKRDLEQAFTNLFLAGFEGILSPRLIDEDYHGFHLPRLDESLSEPLVKLAGAGSSGSPLILLAEGADLIQNMLVLKQNSQIAFLPMLPTSFHCGRLIDLSLKGVGTFHLEWSKKLLKKLIFHSATDKPLQFLFQKNLKNCRVRVNPKDRGKEYLLPFDLMPSIGTTYKFDRFQK